MERRPPGAVPSSTYYAGSSWPELLQLLLWSRRCRVAPSGLSNGKKDAQVADKVCCQSEVAELCSDVQRLEYPCACRRAGLRALRGRQEVPGDAEMALLGSEM